MKSLLQLCAMSVFMILVMGNSMTEPPPKKRGDAHTSTCLGYTIIEAGVGVDCYGDTIRLVKSNGIYHQMD